MHYYKIEGDKKGVTIAVLLLGSKPIVRTNYAVKNNLNVKLFGVEFNSWHAEMRIINLLMRNRYLLNKLKEQNRFIMHVYRYTPTGDYATSSKPCDKCVKVMKEFKRRYMKNGTFLIHYFEKNALGNVEQKILVL